MIYLDCRLKLENYRKVSPELNWRNFFLLYYFYRRGHKTDYGPQKQKQNFGSRTHKESSDQRGVEERFSQ